jgi:glycosyltransferase involved in cell wall biosynthesis
MLYASPFPPLKSGISDYSEILVTALSKKFDITLYTDDYEIVSDKLKQYKVVRHNRNIIDFDSYDYIVYNMGNSQEFHSYIYEACKKHPGMIILHDFVLYYLFMGYYQNKNELYSKVYEANGIEDFLLVKNAIKRNGLDVLGQVKMAARFPFNKELLQTDNKIMVHSQYALNRAKQYANQVKAINMIQQVPESFHAIKREELFSKYKIPQDTFIVASFGMIVQTKLNHIMCGLVSKIANQTGKKICYVMVGEGNYTDYYVDNKTVFKTGFVSGDEFDSFIAYSDIVLNLRHPSMGETSAALLKILQMGKPCVIVDEAWFSEVPDDCVVKLQPNDIGRQLELALVDYISHDEKRRQLGERARRYIAREYAEDKIVDEIVAFLSE